MFGNRGLSRLVVVVAAVSMTSCSSRSVLHDGGDTATGTGGGGGGSGGRGGDDARSDAAGAPADAPADVADARADVADVVDVRTDVASAADGPVVQTSFTASSNRKMDILFVVQNSPSMAPLQSKLLAQFPIFMNVLKSLPTGDGTPSGLPDIHLALLSTDTGPGKFDEPSVQCSYLGDRGQFRSMPTGSCTVTPVLGDSHFLSASMNQTLTNYTGDISSAFTCIGALGEQGCGFAAPFEALRWALDPSNVPLGNEGFLRPDAYLAVTILANQDDCSVPGDSDLFDPTALSTYGPFTRFRCNEFGHLCDVNGTGTLQPPPATGAANNLQGCVSNDTATGKLTHVADEVAFLKSLKSDPLQIFVSAITGPTAPYAVGPDTGGDQHVIRSCMQNATEFAEPAVRIQQWVQAFGNHGLFETACANSYAPALMQIATELGRLLGPPCIGGALVDGDLGTPGVQPICNVSESYIDGGSTARVDLPACGANGNTAPCWTIAPDAPRCGSRLLFNVNRTGAPPPPTGARVSVSCQVCIQGVPNPGCP